MSITSQLPPIALAQASAGLRALAQAAGQTVEARVLSQNANGTTQVQIGRQVLTLTLPQEQPVGATLTLSVQQSDGQLRLGLVSVQPPGATPGGLPPISAAPAASVQLSAAALASPAMSSASITPSTAQGVTPAAVAVHPTVGQAVTGSTSAAGSAAGPVAPPPMTGYGAAPGQGVPAAAPAGGAPMAPSVGSAPVVATTNTPPASPSSAAVVPPASSPVAAVGVGTVAAGNPAQPLSGGGVANGFSTPSAAGVSPSMVPGAPHGRGSAGGVVTASPIVGGGVAARTGIPYAVAAPVAAQAPLTGIASSAATALPPVGQAVSASMVGQHAPSPNMPGTTSPAPAAPQVAVPVVAQPSSPQSALAQMVQQALPRQDSIVGLTTALTAIAGKVALPEPVAKAAQQLLAARLPLDGVKLGGAAIKAAIQHSGVFQEAMLASGQTANGDLKSALLSLRQGLGAWLGNQAPVAQVGGVAPPIRGHLPRARAGEGMMVDLPDDPLEAGKVLLERTEAALSRLRLHQNASLPDANPGKQDAQWSMDLPVIVAGQSHVLHMQIQRDAEQDAERSQERGWQVRFAINLAERGEVGAQISLRAKNTSVLLWADQMTTAQSLAVAVDSLREELVEVGLVPGAVVVRAGAPAEEPVQPMGQAGHMVDATR
jgi:hypothetical protein